MNFKPTIIEEIDGHQLEIRFHGITGRETVLVDGEERINRLNWAMSSDYLVELSENKHIRIRITLDLINTLKVEFLRGGALLRQRTIELYKDASANLLEEPENAAWLAEVKLPYLLPMLAPLALLLGALLFEASNVLVPLLIFIALSLLCLFWLIKPPLPASQPAAKSPLRYLGGALPRAFVLGMCFGGIVGYSFAVFGDSMSRLLAAT